MYQSYLLLRNNEQTGPYSLEQLLQLDLKPFDLVWEEGRSAAWRYPGEIESLQSFIEHAPGVAQAISGDTVSRVNTSITPKKVFVSMPGKKTPAPTPVQKDETDPDAIISQRAESLRLRVQQYASENHPAVPPPLSNSFYEKEEPTYSYFQKSTRKNKISSRQIMILSGIILAAVLSWYFISNDDVALPDVKPPATSVSSIPTAAPVENEANLPVPSLPVKSNPELFVREVAAPSKKPRASQPVKPEKLPETELVINTTPPPPNHVTNEAVNENDAGMPVNDPPAPKKEKKKLREVVRNIFNPKDKEPADVPADETPVPATGRKANKRNNTGDVVTAGEAVRNNIDISSNDKGNWMMGISGMKVTVRNRNNLPVSSVIVTVTYLDVNNKLLEKKELNFKNIPANGKLTLNAPDHRWADHTEISLGVVEVVRDTYALDR